MVEFSGGSMVEAMHVNAVYNVRVHSHFTGTDFIPKVIERLAYLYMYMYYIEPAEYRLP